MRFYKFYVFLFVFYVINYKFHAFLSRDFIQL